MEQSEPPKAAVLVQHPKRMQAVRLSSDEIFTEYFAHRDSKMFTVIFQCDCSCGERFVMHQERVTMNDAIEATKRLLNKRHRPYKILGVVCGHVEAFYEHDDVKLTAWPLVEEREKHE